MSGGGGFFDGVRHALRGFGLIRARGVRVFVIVPLLINVVLFAGALIGAGNLLDYFLDRYLHGWPDWIQWLVDLLEWLVWLLFAALAAVIAFFTFSVVANIIASPFNGLLAEAVEHHLQPGRGAVDTSWRRVLADVRRTLVAELRKLVYIGLRALPLLVLSLIPGLNVLAPALWLLFGAWMLCLEYLDCPLGNHSAFFPRVIDEMRARRPLALGFGLAMTVLTLIPVLNFIAMPVGVAGATSLYCARIAGRAPLAAT